MTEELNNIQNETFDESQKYIDEIKNLKANSVNREAYLKLQEENRNLLKTLVEGKSVEATADAEPSRDTREIIKDLTSDSQTNLDYIKHSLELHDKRMEEGFNDYLPLGHEIAPTEDDIAAAKRVEDFFRNLIETADGNPDVFNNEYQRSVVDIPLPRRK